jgi:hypothetical protein
MKQEGRRKKEEGRIKRKKAPSSFLLPPDRDQP